VKQTSSIVESQQPLVFSLNELQEFAIVGLKFKDA
jgi:hypothetical protein